jgi:DNA replication initiation complex subunit (GINS family)
MSSTIASFFSSFVPTIHADASEEPPAKEDSAVEADAEVVEKADSEQADVEKVVADDDDDEPEDVRLQRPSLLSPFQNIRSYRSSLSFARNVKRRQNAPL